MLFFIISPYGKKSIFRTPEAVFRTAKNGGHKIYE